MPRPHAVYTTMRTRAEASRMCNTRAAQKCTTPATRCFVFGRPTLAMPAGILFPACCGEKVSLGFIADVSQPARHHDIEQMYRQRTRQYKVELKKLEALAAKERERLLAEERAHARRLAATGEAPGGADDQAYILVMLPSDSCR